MKAALYTLGCKVNKYDTDMMEQELHENGFDIVSKDEIADIYVVSSCTVTGMSDKKTRQTVRRIRRSAPESVIVLTGCFPQAFPDEAEELTEADVVMGTSCNADLIKNINSFLKDKKRIIEIKPHNKDESFELTCLKKAGDRTRAFVKIEDGCDRYCRYCIIPTARGRVRSKPIKELENELALLAENGYKEIVLVGINLSSYGKDIGLRLVDAISLACAIDGIERVRLGSLEPELLSDDDIDKMSKMEKLCPQFHLSLQSGCDKTLREMNRRYDRQEYARIVKSLRAHFENCSITTDIMVGFPGETDEDFKESLSFAEDIAFAKAHVFAYSKREGTPAAQRKDQIEKTVKDKRSRKMIEVTDITRRDFLSKQVGRIESVLLETCHNNVYEGFTRNYVPVCVKSCEDIREQIVNVMIMSSDDEKCIGTVIGNGDIL